MITPKNKYLYICKWKAEHPDKIREYRKIWEKRNPEAVRESIKRWRQRHPNYSKEWRKKHPEAYKYIRKEPEDLRYERNKLIYQARTIQGLTYRKIGEMFRGKEGKPMSKQRVQQIVKDYHVSLDLPENKEYT